MNLATRTKLESIVVEKSNFSPALYHPMKTALPLVMFPLYVLRIGEPGSERVPLSSIIWVEWTLPNAMNLTVQVLVGSSG